ncbi:MAG: WYL domain-containing protein [Myxococcales bacterium]|nr:WYL domain-containing protein [Myxococcales bacterium]
MKPTSQRPAKRNESAEKGLRLLTDLMKGKQHDRQSASTLLGIEAPAATRYLKSLENVPGVEHVAGVRGLTLRFNPSQVMEPPHFSVVVAACLSMSLASLFEGTTYEEGIVKACAFLLNRSTRKHRFGKSADLARKFIFVKGGGELALPDKAGMLDDIIEAILTQRSIAIKHTDLEDVPRDLVVRPLSIVVYKHQLYVLVCNPENRILNLRFSRIQECSVTEEAFPYPPRAEYDPVRLFEPCFGVFINLNKPLEVVRIKLSDRWKTYVRTHRWHRSQEIKFTADGVLVKLQVQICPELIGWILSFGAEAEVLEPAGLRETVRTKIQEMVQKYAA